MVKLLYFLILFLIITLLILQKISIRITYFKKTIIQLDILFFTLYFYPAQGKKRKKLTFKDKLMITNLIRATLSFLLSHSDVHIKTINFDVHLKDPINAAFYSGGISTIVSFLITYISLKANSLATDDDAFIQHPQYLTYSNPAIDITLETSFSYIISASIIFLYLIITKRGGKIVRR